MSANNSATEDSCTHEIQLHGLCALCGKDVVALESSEINYRERATISMAHNIMGLTVSHTEAERLEEETSQRLLKEKKLSLIVDLDQTLIHATVDSTVEEWFKDENNKNNPVIKDIHKFVLPDSPTVYYIKLRPGIQEFLKEISVYYEPHIYTMGTRNYASAVANVIDPDNEIFNERILSRDESGSITQKNIRRLFPCNDYMVVVIDDRADVWGWSPNLIKVQPYDFFVGIGDINDTYLPKQTGSNLVSDLTSVSTNIDMKEVVYPDTTESKKSMEQTEQTESIEKMEQTGSIDMSIDNSNIAKETIEISKDSKEQQSETNKSLDLIEKETVKTDKVDFDDMTISNKIEKQSETNNTNNGFNIVEINPSNKKKRTFEEIADDIEVSDEKSLKRQQKELSSNNIDTEILEQTSPLHNANNQFINRKLILVLKNIHQEFYDEYDIISNELNERIDDEIDRPDVTLLMPQMKSKVLKGVNILFTHVIPTNQKKDSTEIWLLANEFGAECSEYWNKNVTHLVAGDGTEKVKQAKKYGSIHIVRKEWLYDSIRTWERQPEENYALEITSPREQDDSA
ncbi:20405_t:CDS:10 [Entrophospora sp. SA101]|nr:5410_t:CDS:10 [Entrophospora sp. SA101]CAJ0749060.1 20405_t:CDS:10 [Entrophospora sp. SA101]CAJ0824206.1 1393_t:CDS:10 [Entrophospora sp. SA101]CAJ0831965.1 22144_t:CDS:10 [Entrophospora sp. SA101]CAJ0841248.1 13779_t:CDS:10 [Entrophospora sp. SA101]